MSRVLERASNSGEKWLSHMTAAKVSQATTGMAQDRARPADASTGRIQRWRTSGDGGAQELGDRRAERDQRRGDEHQQQVLDHVDREERRVVALDARHQGDGDRGEAAEERRGRGRSGHGCPGAAARPGGPARASRRRATRAASDDQPARTSSRGGASARSAAPTGTGAVGRDRPAPPGPAAAEPSASAGRRRGPIAAPRCGARPRRHVARAAPDGRGAPARRSAMMAAG